VVGKMDGAVMETRRVVTEEGVCDLREEARRRSELRMRESVAT